MPSLQALQEFKTSFNNLGDELSVRKAENLAFEDLELPGSEPEVSTGGSPLPGPSAKAPEGDDADFLALLDTIPDDLASPAGEPETDFFEPGTGPETPEGEAEASEPEPADLPPMDDFNIPGDLLNGLANDLEAAPADDFGGEFPAGEAPGGDVAADMPGLDDFSIPDLDMAEDLGGETDEPVDGEAVDLLAGMENPEGEPAEDVPGGFSADSLNLGNELSTEEAPGGDIAADMPGLDDFSIPDLDMAEDLGGETDEPAGEEAADLSAGDESGGVDFSIPEDGGFNMGGETGMENPDVPAGDSFDAFNLGGDVSPPAGDTGAGIVPLEDEFGDLEEFALPGIDDVFGGVPTGGRTGLSSARGGTGEAAEEVEEIQLSDEDLAAFQKTLAGYPLNLRIACEELIAEQAVAPDLMSKLVKLLIRGAPARETAALAGKILDRTINIPRGFEKSTGEALEAEQASFAYIFVHNFLPVLRLFLMIAIVGASLFYLIHQFVYTPLRAESIYKTGYERVFAGEYQRANDRFSEAFRIHRNKDWFYRYAEAFRDERQYIYAEEKYDELLRFYPRDKKGVLDYAAMETGYLRNYAKAEELLRRNLLDYAPNDREGLLALGDNSLAWGEIDKSKYEDARFSYARLLERYGWTDPVVERMMKYFIRTDNLQEVLPLQAYFDNKKRKISAVSLAELGGYLLDKRLEEVQGVPNEYVERIEGIRDILLRAVQTDPALPEPHYHLSRYYQSLGNAHEEQITLETAIRAFDSSPEDSVRRINYRIDAQKRYADILINNREFFRAEEQLIKGIGIYEDAFSRRLLARSPEFGKLYASLGDLEYFTKAGDMETALQYYRRSEQQGWAPPEMLYRMGSAHYHRGEWRDALERFFTASAELPLNRRLLYALGNAFYQRRDYSAAQGYYNRLLDILESERSRLPLLLPNDRPEFVELAERLMIARNNMGATLEALAEQTGDNRYRSRALALYSESARAWDALTRNPESMIRRRPAPNMAAPGDSLPYLNSRNALYPRPGFEPQIFIQIDKDVLEPSIWEHLSSQGGGLAPYN
ncbi:MAG: tetratricopeptide repeat protein [Treponema sp.]|jgi:tetratricopeptide (TPR) repeat protein|nr:tetratricopeptide repeat protein [Treponema sp.]